jgi:hypothetical protein
MCAIDTVEAWWGAAEVAPVAELIRYLVFHVTGYGGEWGGAEDVHALHRARRLVVNRGALQRVREVGPVGELSGVEAQLGHAVRRRLGKDMRDDLLAGLLVEDGVHGVGVLLAEEA